MLEEAKKKLQKEIGENAGNPYIQVVGQFLLQHISAHPEDAEKILQKDKTISKSLNAMRKEAEKKKVGNCAVLTDQEGFDYARFAGKKGEGKKGHEELGVVLA